MTFCLGYGHCECMAVEQSNLENQHTSLTVLVIVLLIAAVIYVFGYLRAVMHRANKDYKATKAAVKPLRKAFWGAWWSALKLGFWVAIAFAVLFIWVVRDVRSTDVDEKRKLPAKITTHKPSHPAPTLTRRR